MKTTETIIETTSFTRKEYLDGKCTHREYYAQFVTNGIRETVLERFGKSLFSSTDPHLNDIALRHWDNLSRIAMRGGFSLSDCVCTLKEAARQIIESNI